MKSHFQIQGKIFANEITLVLSDRELLSWDGEGSRGQLCRVAKIPGCLKIFPKTVKRNQWPKSEVVGCGRDWVPGWGGDIQEGGGLLYALPGPASFAHHAVTQTGSFLSLSNHIPPQSKTPCILYLHPIQSVRKGSFERGDMIVSAAIHECRTGGRICNAHCLPLLSPVWANCFQNAVSEMTRMGIFFPQKLALCRIVFFSIGGRPNSLLYSKLRRTRNLSTDLSDLGRTKQTNRQSRDFTMKTTHAEWQVLSDKENQTSQSKE